MSTNRQRLAEEEAKHTAGGGPIIRREAPPVPSRSTAAASDDIRQKLVEEIGGLRVNLGKLLELVEAMHAVIVVPPEKTHEEDPADPNKHRRHR
jgi:hypothetical protein